MARFLIFFSYIGTHYRGVQLQYQAGEVITRIKTVQGVLENYLQKLKPVNRVTVKVSSRTDKDVHALCNSCHVDLEHRLSPLEFNPRWITHILNRSLTKDNERLRILNTVRVLDAFSSRHEAKERSYVYRVAVVKNPSSKRSLWTAQDAEVIFLICPPFDTELFVKAAEILSGTHSFLSFSVRSILTTRCHLSRQSHIGIHIQRSTTVMEEHQHDVSDTIDSWEVHFRGRSFIYKQVRRMMGAMVAVARGHMTTKQLQHYLDNPSLWTNERIQTLPGLGLTLKEVHYPEDVFNYSLSEVQMEAPDPESLADSAEHLPRLCEVVAPRTVHCPSSSPPCAPADSLLTTDRFDSDGTGTDDEEDNARDTESCNSRQEGS